MEFKKPKINIDMYLVFDTETTGLPLNWNAPAKNVENWPRIIQLAFVVMNDNFQIITEYCELIKPDGWEIPNEKFWIDNGYSTQTNIEKGVPIEKALTHFILQMSKCEYLIAHNMKYDLPVTAAEMIRLGMSSSHKPKKICTMLSTVDLMNLPRKKWPKLEELHERLFGSKFDNAHDALADVKATARCFAEIETKKYLKNWVLL